MEFTFEDIQKKIDESLLSHPELGVAGKRIRETSLLKELLSFIGIDSRHHSDIEFEVLLVTALYTPLSELPQNISESTSIPLVQSVKLANMIEAVLLDDVIENLRSYDIVLRSEEGGGISLEANLETKERLELRPRVGGEASSAQAASGTPANKEAAAKPLTRDELMNALAGKRTMAQDIEALRQKQGGGK